MLERAGVPEMVQHRTLRRESRLQDEGAAEEAGLVDRGVAPLRCSEAGSGAGKGRADVE